MHCDVYLKNVITSHKNNNTHTHTQCCVVSNHFVPAVYGTWFNFSTHSLSVYACLLRPREVYYFDKYRHRKAISIEHFFSRCVLCTRCLLYTVTNSLPRRHSLLCRILNIRGNERYVCAFNIVYIYIVRTY